MQDKSRRILFWLIVVVAVALLTFGLFNAHPVAGPGQSGIAPAASGPTPSYAPKGQLVSGFPQELILDSAAQVSNSYSIHYSAALDLYAAEWNSSSSMASLYASYQDYFSKNHWTITNKAASNAALRGIYATNGLYDVNVTIVARGGGSHVLEGYGQTQKR
jgi:hypothetical protein